MIFVAVNLDPFEAHEAEIEFPLHAMSIPEDETFEVEELLDGAKHLWRGQRQHVRLDPHANPAAIFRVNPRSEQHTSELQSLMRISYAVSCLKKKHIHHHYASTTQNH